MTPIVFNDCAGWLHRPPPGSAVGRGVVLCDAFGYEGLCTQRAMAQLATMLAAAGMPVLRFHYPGTGNSAGDETEGQIESWLDSIDVAISTLRERSGVAEIALCGLRLGATLAVEAAKRRDDIHALALIMPVVQGRHYVRELILSASMVTSGAEQEAPSPWTEVLGYRLHRRDLERLRQIDLRAPDAIAAAPRNLTLTPEPGAAPVGPGVESLVFPGLSGLLADTEDIVIPMPAFAAAVAWLGKAAPAGLAVLPPPAARDLVLANGVIEQVVRFERAGVFFGVLCRPPRSPRKDCVLILNTGVNHHTGNGRGSVRLARRLAAGGLASLRIDTDGIGDSLPIDPGTPTGFHDLARILDVQKALDFLEEAGYSGVTVLGICAGAYLGLHAAVADHRIVRAILANLPYFYVEEEDPRVASWRKWLHLKPWWALRSRPEGGFGPAQPGRHGGVTRAERVMAKLLGLSQASEALGTVRALHLLRVWVQQMLLWPARMILPDGVVLGHTDRMLATLKARATPLLLAYSPDDPGLFEFHASFPDGGRRLRRLDWARVATIERADHVMTIAEMQNAYALLIEEELGINGQLERRKGQSAEAPHFERREVLSTHSERTP